MKFCFVVYVLISVSSAYAHTNDEAPPNSAQPLRPAAPPIVEPKNWLEHSKCESTYDIPNETYDIRVQPGSQNPLRFSRITTTNVGRSESKIEVTERMAEAKRLQSNSHIFYGPETIVQTDYGIDPAGARTLVFSKTQREGLEKTGMGRQLLLEAPIGPQATPFYRLRWQPKRYEIVRDSCAGIRIPTDRSRPPAQRMDPDHCVLLEVAQENGEYVRMIVLYSSDERAVGYSVRKACGAAFGFPALDRLDVFRLPDAGDARLLVPLLTLPELAPR